MKRVRRLTSRIVHRLTNIDKLSRSVSPCHFSASLSPASSSKLAGSGAINWRKNFTAASFCLILGLPFFFPFKVLAQAFEQPASVVTATQSVSVPDNTATVAAIGASGSLSVTVQDNLPGSSKDGQSGGGPQAPVVPAAPGMPQVDATTGLIPAVAGVPLSPAVPALVVDGSAATAPAAPAAAVSAPADTAAVAPISAPSASAPMTSPVAAVSAPVESPVGAALSAAISPDAGAGVALAAPSNLALDLSSSQATIVAPVSAPTSIIVGGTMGADGVVSGGTALVVSPGQMVTPSQYIALTQVTGSGSQSIVLNADGAGQSGALSLVANQTDTLSTLVVPSNITLYGIGFNSADPLVVMGGSNIAGNLYTLQSGSATESSLNFGNLTVSGLLSGSAPVVSSPILSVLMPSGGLFSSSGLSINAVGSVFNTGTIASPGVLSITAGSNISNSGMLSGSTVNLTAQSVSNYGTVLASAGNVNLNAMSGSFVNSGLIAAPLGSINVNTDAATLASNINFDNLGGTLRAAQNIQFRNSDYSGDADISITGGDLLSNAVNINAGQGTADLNVGELTGTLSTYGLASHVIADTAVLNLGEQCLTGDPTYYNSGNINISGNITVGEKLAVIASGNITNSGAGGYSITARNAGVGQDITMIAGAAFTTASAGAGTATLTGAPPSGAVPGGGTVTVTGGSAAGGSITLTTGAGVSLIDASGTTGAGGNVTLLAFADATGATGGTIALPTGSNIRTDGASGFANGNITLGAGRTGGAAGNSIQAGSLTAFATGTTGGSINVTVGQPTVVGGVGGGVQFDSTGSVVNGGSFSVSAGTGADRRISIGAGAGQSILSGGSASIAAPSLVNLNVGTINTNGGNFTIDSGLGNTSINLNAGTMATQGGAVNITAGDNITFLNGTLNTSPAAGAGGAVNLLADRDGVGTGAINTSTLSIVASGVGGAGGNVLIENQLTAAGNQSLNIGSITSAGTVGGNILLHSYGGSITSRALTSAAGGSVKVLAGANGGGTGQSINMLGDINTGGASLALVSTGGISSGASMSIATGGGSALLASGVRGTAQTSLSAASNIDISDRSGQGGSVSLTNVSSFNTGSGNLNVTAFSNSAGGATGGAIALAPAVPIVTGGGNATLVAEQTNAGGNSIAVAGGINVTGGAGAGTINVSTATPGFPGVFNSATGAISGTITGGTLRNGGVNLGSLQASAGTSSVINVGRVDSASAIQGNLGALSVQAASGLIRVGPLTTSGLTTVQNGVTGDITIVGAVSNTGGGLSFTTSGSAANGGIITVGAAVTQTGAGDLSFITSGAGSASNIVFNAAASESGAGSLIVQTSGANSDITVAGALSSDAGSPLTITAGDSGSASIDVSTAGSIAGDSLTLNTPVLTVAGNGSVTSNAGALTIKSSLASGALNVSLSGAAPTLRSSSGDVFFNQSGSPGAVTITGGAAAGLISANGGNGTINLNGGSSAVSANVRQFDGFVKGSGSTFAVNSGLAGADLKVSGVSASSNISLVSAGGLLISGDVSNSAGTAVLTAGNSGSAAVNLSGGADVNVAGNLTVNSGVVSLGAGSVLTTTTGDVFLQSNFAGNALNLSLAAGAQINAAAATGDIFFNPSAAGAITVTGGAAAGLLNAGNTVSLRGGAVDVNVNQINGRVVSNGATITTSTVTTAAGDLSLGGYTSSGATSFTANGAGADIIVNGALSNGVGGLALQAGAGADSDVRINSAVTSSGLLNINSGTGAGSDITIAASQLAQGATVNANSASLNLGTNAGLRANTGALNIQSNSGGTLNVTLASGAFLRSTSSNVNFNSAGSPGAITMTGGLGSVQAGGATPQVVFNGGSSAVDVNVSSIVGSAGGTGSTFSLVTQSGDLRVGPVTSTGTTLLQAAGNGADLITTGAIDAGAGNLTLATGTGTNADIRLNNNVTTTGTLLVNTGTGAGSDLAVASAVTVSGGATTITTPTMSVANGATVRATAQDLQISGSASGGPLAVTLGGANATLSSATGNVNFNSVANPGAVTISGGPASGVISANGGNGNINLNGGTNAVNVSARQLDGFVNGTGSTFSVNSGLAGNDLKISGVSASSNISLVSAGGVLISGNVSNTAGTGVITAGNSGAAAVSLQGGADVSVVGNLNVNSGVVNLGAGSVLTSTAGDVTLQSNFAGNALNLAMSAGSQINAAAAGGDIFFNPSTAGNITVTGGPGDGLLNAANTVSFRGGTVAVNVNQINGRVVSNGTTISTAGVNTAQGDLNIGAFRSSGATNFTAGGAGADIVVGGTLTNGTGGLTLQAGSGLDSDVRFNAGASSTGTLTINSGTGAGSEIILANSQLVQGATVNANSAGFTLGTSAGLRANTGALSLQSNGAGGALNISAGSGALLRSVTSSVNLNGTTAGAITMVGGTGALQAGGASPAVNFNGGSNAVDVNVASITGNASGTGSTYSVVTQTGNLNIGPVTSTGTTTFRALGSGADIVTTGAIDAGAGVLTIGTGNGANADIRLNHNISTTGALTVDSGSGTNSDVALATGVIVSGGLTTVNTPTLSLANNAVLRSTNGDLQISGSATGGPVRVSLLGGSSELTSQTGNVNFNSAANPGAVTISGSSVNGIINAAGGAGFVNFNGSTANNVSVTASRINGITNGTAATMSLTLANPNSASGTFDLGTITTNNTFSYSTPITGNIRVSGDITSNTGLVNLTSGTGAANSITLASGVDLRGQTGINLNTANLNLQSGPAAATVTAVTGNLSVQSNTASRALNIQGTGTPVSSLNALAGAIGLNQSNVGSITVGGSVNLIASGNLNARVGTGSLTVNANQISSAGLNVNNGLATLAGAITVNSQSGDLLFASPVRTNGGAVVLGANGGSLSLSGNDINTSRATGGGSVSLSALNGISGVGNIITTGVAGAGGNVSLSSAGQNIIVNTIQTRSTNAAGGNVTSSSANLRVIGIDGTGQSISATGSTGGTVNITTTSTNPFIIGDASVNGTASGINANGSNQGGKVIVAANGVTVNAGRTVSAVGGTGAGGVVTFTANNPANGNTVFNIGGTVSATGGTPATGVVAVGAPAGWAFTLNLPGVINAGQQLTLGNFNALSGLPTGLPSGLITLNPQPAAVLPSPPYNTPFISYNGALTPPLIPGGSGTGTPGSSGSGSGIDDVLLRSNNNLNDDAGLRISTDLTQVFPEDSLDQEIQTVMNVLARRKESQDSNTIGGSVTHKSDFTPAEIARLNSEGIVTSGETAGSKFGLVEGNLVFAPEHDITVHFNEGKLFIPADSVVFVMKTKDSVGIYDLHQRGQGGVSVVASKKLIQLDPGRLLVLTSQPGRDFDRVGGQFRMVGYRNARQQDLSDDLRAFAMDFSLPSALTNVLPLKQMLDSSNRLDQIAIQRVLKDGALLGELTGAAGPYKSSAPASN